MQTITNIREKLKRKLSLHDKNPKFDEYNTADDVDEETHGHLSREVDHSTEADEPHGRPGSFLNKLIMHGNKKTEDELAREAALRGEGNVGTNSASGVYGSDNVRPTASETGTTATTGRAAGTSSNAIS